jgi:pSer/pThr/pTyr-binding forkhead associated (FHA) protein
MLAVNSGRVAGPAARKALRRRAESVEENSMSKSRAEVNLKLIEGRAFILGRQGHIFIDSITASNQHAEIRIVNQKIYLRDLDSTNGTFVIKNGAPVRIKKGYVQPDDIIVIGGVANSVVDLLGIANDFAETGGATTEIQVVEGDRKQA